MRGVREGGPKTELSTAITDGGSLRTVTRVEEPELGSHLGQFRVEARIGRGGLGIVYRAYDEKLKRAVALKVLADASSSAGGHLLEEARAAASLMHPSIAAIHDVQVQNGIVFIVMELVAGTTLRAEIARGPMKPDAVLRYARDLASGLARAHQSGIVHRDLKPENVMVTPEGSLKILDFGLARQAPEVSPPSGEAGDTTGIAGTPDYMAPEQTRGGRVDARADVFSLGVVLSRCSRAGGRSPSACSGRGRRTTSGSSSRRSSSWRRARPRAPPDRRALPRRSPLGAIRGRRRGAGGAEGRRRPGAHPAAVARDAAREVGQAWAYWPRARSSSASSPRGRARERTARRRLRPPHPSRPSRSPPRPSRSRAAGSAPVSRLFADDGSVVFAQQDGAVAEIHRLDLASGTDTALTDDRGLNQRPARGDTGQIVYMLRSKAQETGNEARSVPLAGGPPRPLLRGGDPVVAAGRLFFVPDENRSIRRSALDGSAQEVLYDSPPSLMFDSLAVSSDGQWLAASVSGPESRRVTTLCVGHLGEERGPLDCSAGPMTSGRATFAPDGHAVYFMRGDMMIRLDPETRATRSVRVEAGPTNLAIAPDGTPGWSSPPAGSRTTRSASSRAGRSRRSPRLRRPPASSASVPTASSPSPSRTGS